MSDVNHQLVQDVEDSGQFMTMFYLNLEATKMQARWVRAGHDPAIFSGLEVILKNLIS
jgi:sigma-B regulation protein RsbU (phosphoserine phosphatase)